MKTSKDYTTEFRHYGAITVPAGTKVTHQTALGIDENYHFVNEFEWVKVKYPDFSNTLIMDLDSYGLNIPKEYIDYP